MIEPNIKTYYLQSCHLHKRIRAAILNSSLLFQIVLRFSNGILPSNTVLLLNLQVVRSLNYFNSHQRHREVVFFLFSIGTSGGGSAIQNHCKGVRRESKNNLPPVSPGHAFFDLYTLKTPLPQNIHYMTKMFYAPVRG